MSYRLSLEGLRLRCPVTFLEVCQYLFQLLLFRLGVILRQLQVVPPVAAVESPVADPVLGSVRVAHKLLRAEKAAALQAFYALGTGLQNENKSVVVPPSVTIPTTINVLLLFLLKF